jgi:hypothetical protein
MREQAKKMNVASLRSADQANTSAEIKLAKVRNTIQSTIRVTYPRSLEIIVNVFKC